MIAQKKTETIGGVDTPVLKVLASNGTRTWVGTEDALNAAIANGEIAPGTVADTYVESDDPLNIDFATKEYCRQQNRISAPQSGGDMKIMDIYNPGTGYLYSNVLTAPYDGYWVVSSSIWSNWSPVENVQAVIQSSKDGTTWTVLVGMGWTSGTALITIPVLKDYRYRVQMQGTTSSHKELHTMATAMYYKERDYSTD